MRVNTKQAVKLFFQNTSLVQVFKEAIANSLDAKATQINVNIFIDSFEKQETLRIEIIDNGEGFTDERFKKFCELLNVDEDTHQGVGRLVYLSYFNEIEVKSYFQGKLRTFTFDDNFDEDNSNMRLTADKGGGLKCLQGGRRYFCRFLIDFQYFVGGGSRFFCVN